MSSGEHARTMTLDQALNRLRELEQIMRIARPVLSTVSLRRGDPMQQQAAKALVQLDALRL